MGWVGGYQQFCVACILKQTALIESSYLKQIAKWAREDRKEADHLYDVCSKMYISGIYTTPEY